MIHSFTAQLKKVLSKHFKEDADQIFQNSELLKYLNLKTKSADKGSKSRGSFGNLYAIYVLVEEGTFTMKETTLFPFQHKTGLFLLH